MFKEDFLQYLWKYQLFSTHNLVLSCGDELIVVKSGTQNSNSGPDFLNAHLKINNQVWVGNVEIHVKSSNWYTHKHEVDINYDAVILHVVWQDDVAIYMKNNKPLPTLVLKDFILEDMVKKYQNLFSTNQRWILCENQINSINSFVFDNWKERLFFERLQHKSETLKDLLQFNNFDFEVTLFQLLVKNFGLKINGDSFLRLAKSIDLSVVRKVRFNEDQLAALFFGQAGFLQDTLEDAYFLKLKNEYHFIKHKYQLKPLPNNQFYFFRMRPNNFPTIRIAQLIALFYKNQNFFIKLINFEKLSEFYNFFEIEINPFWKTHYTFKKQSKPVSKNLTKSFIDLVLINTIIPLKFLYQQNRGEVREHNFLELLKELKPEKNSIISNFKDLGVSVKNSFDTQALLELKSNYCNFKRCLHCAIGNKLLSNSDDK